mmetsp:Transcript_25439/g.59221  ORF Transcript_25439/g.59221 Transcript_25439/m.59221 type:complete len:365 (-) Transcript_25439:155-1249(-)|eukprot:CAMPEP_0178389310 /NCGR_PEP_ID=MMETSP0689_2-20121128/10049_1 /TAXON_ID=160604 /ORGANISM="Amphidinium massartii, Strain CS-259" /LENGTH=364 /DNA_ID=CAMNT_0020009753 /DNA_START=127 /DNA_END=1221 /DNA_ORIENTATION=+
MTVSTTPAALLLGILLSAGQLFPSGQAALVSSSVEQHARRAMSADGAAEAVIPVSDMVPVDLGREMVDQPPRMSRSEQPEEKASTRECSGGSCAACFAGGLCLGVVITALVIMVLGEALGQVKLRNNNSYSAAEAVGGSSNATDDVSGASGAASASKAPELATEPIQAAQLEEHHHSETESIESMHLFWPRLSVLIVLLLIQSTSSVILAGFQSTFATHPAILHFLTMLVGTGGNCGGQSVVLAVRKLAIGEDVDFIIAQQALVGVCLAAILAPLAFARSFIQHASVLESLTIAAATAILVVLATSLGAALPKMFAWLRVDPAHATPTIQVAMDIVGVSIVCLTTWLFLTNSSSSTAMLQFLGS